MLNVRSTGNEIDMVSICKPFAETFASERLMQGMQTFFCFTGPLLQVACVHRLHILDKVMKLNRIMECVIL